VSIDIRTMKQAGGRSINLALSVRGISALEGASAGKGILETLIPMKGRMIHVGEGKLASQPYGVFGEVCLETLALLHSRVYQVVLIAACHTTLINRTHTDHPNDLGHQLRRP
jgi:kynurenine 3-monooxygenase